MVVFVGERAIKVLKPVSLGFLDYTTLDARAEACRREVELNRRLAPDVYLGVAEVLDAERQPCEHLIVMRRMPADRRLSALVDGPGAADLVREVAKTVAAFHAAADTGPEVDRAAEVDNVARNWQDNLAAMEPFVGSVLDEDEFAAVRRLAGRYLAGRRALFEARIAGGAARDGHGDLLADDIFCLDDGPRILDCLAFDDNLRYGDVLADVAFLVMDLERLGQPALARRLLRWYEEFSGERHPASLALHYTAYRAHVRAKVACLRHAQGDADAAVEARARHRQAHGHLREAEVRLVVVGGAPGVGKSTLSDAIAERTGWTVLRSDVVRKELAGLGAGTDATAPPGEGIYRAAATEQTYAELLSRATRLLGLGETVVLDASWSSAAHRGRARDVADATESSLVELRCDAPEAVAGPRIAARRQEGGDPSDATREVAARLAERADPWPEATVVDTTVPLPEATAAALDAIGAPSGP